jgi:hypothetical protein
MIDTELTALQLLVEKSLHTPVGVPNDANKTFVKV